MQEAPKRNKQSQLTLILRTACGAYLLYLAWGLAEATFSGGHPGYLAALILFALVGAALVFISGRHLLKGEFLRPGETGEDEQPPEDAP